MPKTDHPIEREELMAYLDGELPADRASMAAGHLERCRECQDLAADLQTVSRRMLEWEIEPSGQEMSSALASAVISSDDQSRKRNRQIRRWIGGLATVGAFSLSVFVVIFNMTAPRFQLNHESHGVAMLVSPSPKIVRTAQLTLTTRDFDKARTGLEDVLKRHSGYIGLLTVNAPANAARTLNTTLHIPAAEREGAIAEIKRLGHVEAESQTGEDVTSDYVDLEARLSNARNTEQRLTEILHQRAGKLSDVLEVEKEISRVRGEIERMEVEKKALTTRVDFLTLEVTLTEERPVQSHNSFVDAAVAGYRRVVEGGANIILFLLAYGPNLLLWLAILFFPARWAWKRFRRG